MRTRSDGIWTITAIHRQTTTALLPAATLLPTAVSTASNNRVVANHCIAANHSIAKSYLALLFLHKSNAHTAIGWLHEQCRLSRAVCQILDELLQNADDAGARRCAFLLDHRQHGQSKLFRGEGDEACGDLHSLQGDTCCHSLAACVSRRVVVQVLLCWRTTMLCLLIKTLLGFSHLVVVT